MVIGWDTSNIKRGVSRVLSISNKQFETDIHQQWKNQDLEGGKTIQLEVDLRVLFLIAFVKYY